MIESCYRTACNETFRTRCSIHALKADDPAKDPRITARTVELNTLNMNALCTLSADGRRMEQSDIENDNRHGQETNQI